MQLGAEDAFFASRRRHTRFKCDWSSDVCSSDLKYETAPNDMAKDALRQQRAFRQQRARAICGIINDLTVTNWVRTVKHTSEHHHSFNLLALLLLKKSTSISTL